MPHPDLPRIHREITDWYLAHARNLPWRRDPAGAWAVMVSEFMLQQTPVVRVLPVWEAWMERWPTPAALAAALPGIGTYTAAAIACFAFKVPTVVVDTNIRRVHARLVGGKALPEQNQNAAELALAARLLPESGPGDPGGTALANGWNIAVMELGALVCTARSPRCEDCPVLESCAWIAAGRPEPHYKPKGQPWHGTDRQVRGAMMAVLRHSAGPVERGELLGVPDLALEGQGARRLNPAREGGQVHQAWVDLHALEAGAEQRERALASLLADGLAQHGPAGIGLPH